MNILVTGIHGFVGSNLVVALKERHSLYGLDIVAPEKEGVVKTFFWKDIEPASFPMRNLPEFDAIIHLAGKAHDTKNRSRLAAPAVLRHLRCGSGRYPGLQQEDRHPGNAG